MISFRSLFAITGFAIAAVTVTGPALAAEAALDVHRGRHHVQPRDRIQIADIAALKRRGVHRDDLLVGRVRRREAIGVRLAGEPIGERGRFGHG